MRKDHVSEFILFLVLNYARSHDFLGVVLELRPRRCCSGILVFLIGVRCVGKIDDVSYLTCPQQKTFEMHAMSLLHM